jgi:hypothetical protein
LLIMLMPLSRLTIILLPPWGGPSGPDPPSEGSELDGSRTALGRQRLNLERPE